MSKRRSLPLLLVAGIACQDASNPAALQRISQSPTMLLSPVSQGSTAEQVVPGRVLVRFAAGVTLEDVAGPLGLTVEGRGYTNAFVMLRAPLGTERALSASLRTDARVVFAEPDYLRLPTVDPRLWAFNNPGGLAIQFTQGPNRGNDVVAYLSTADADEDAGGGDVTETYGAGGASVIVGSIDTGVEFSHPEFDGLTLIAGDDWYSGDTDPSDRDGHGTHTAATMVGVTMGVAAASGASPNVQLHVQRVCGRLGCPSSAIANAIRAAADYGVVAMNVSIAGASPSQVEADAIAYALSLNALVIASAGNTGTGTLECPACDPNVISVGATNWRDAQTYYTSWGTGLDIVAPGGELYSNATGESGILSAVLDGDYAYFQGTSMSAPQVTGTAGVVASKTGATGAALRARLLGSADDKGQSGYDTRFGCGRLNTHRAVTLSAGSLSGCEDPSTGGSGGLNPAITVSCKGSATCSFKATTSADATTYFWDFGDGASGSGVMVSHTYSAAAAYEVSLTVGDGTNAAETTRTVNCTLKGPALRCR